MDVLDTQINPRRSGVPQQCESNGGRWSRSCANSSPAPSAGGGERYLQRHREQGKLPVRERISRLLDPGSPLLELSPLAAWDMYDNEAPGAGLVTGIGRVSGREVLIVGQRRHGEGRHVLPDHGEETSPGSADRTREPASLHLPGRLWWCVPAVAGGGLSGSRSLRPHLLQPGADVGARHPSDRRRHGLVHRWRRLRARDVRRNHHREGHGHDFSGRSPTRQSRHRRGRDRRGTRRRRRPHALVGCGRLPGRRRRPCVATDANDHQHAQHAQEPAAGHDDAARSRPTTLREIYGIVNADVRKPYDVREVIARSSTDRGSTSSSSATRRRWSPASPGCTASSSASWPTTACCSPNRRSRPRTSSSCAI